MYRVSVTTLEKFRRYMDGVSSFDTEEAFLNTLKGIFKGTPKTEFGGAYHLIIEGKFYLNPLTRSVYAGDYVFTEKQAAPALKYRQEHPSMTHEMNVRKIYQSKYFPIQVVGRVDAVEGLIVNDAKAKFRTPDWQEYIDSCQWKFYLDMLECDVFHYDVFQIEGFKEEEYSAKKLFPEIVINEPLTLECVRDHHLESDIMSVLNDFLDYISLYNLFSFLKPALKEEPFF